MCTLTKLSLGLIAAFAYSTALVQPVLAHDLELVVQAKGGGKGKPKKEKPSDKNHTTSRRVTWRIGCIYRSGRIEKRR